MEMPASDKPDDHVVADDAQLDLWFVQYQRDVARRQGKHVGDSRYSLLGDETAQAVPVFGGGDG